MIDLTNWEAWPRKTDKVAFVGFSASSRHLAPYNNPEYEVWILNEEYNFPWTKSFDRIFQIHQDWDWGRDNNPNDPNHKYWLENRTGVCRLCGGKKVFKTIKGDELPCTVCDENGNYILTRPQTDFPIYMQKAFPSVPNSVEYPLNQITDTFLRPMGLDRHYFRSSFSIMMGLALLMGFKHIEAYGFEMGTDTEYNYQRPNGEFWMGYCMGYGVKLILPDNCGLLRGPLYGYEDSRVGYRQNLEIRRKVLDKQVEKFRNEIIRTDAEADLVRKFVEDGIPDDLPALLNEKAVAYSKAQGMFNFVRGARTELDNLGNMYDKYFIGSELTSKDPRDHHYEILEENVQVEYESEK